ncbi:hypothetical protein [Nocardia ignorata]|uniref:Uncharacterized protein n=1 Tax=Nocardia ignorata TaxID=145285 RepID=A0A4R6PN73_NOCIG|nr:hypothetical protein [Nocardia ignorata]TDP39981.1 hypothetical protein DFR75_102703 [Nocardia ignorata]
MVTSSHEAMHRIFQHDAAAIAHAFVVLNLPFAKPTAVEQVCVDLTETAPVERRADTVLDITTVDDRFLMVVEAQSAPDDSGRTLGRITSRSCATNTGCRSSS